MKTWTEEQRELFEVGPDGLPRLSRVAVSADAGSGKTSVLVERVKTVLSGTGAAVTGRVLCVSFTEKSKADLEQRLAPWIQAEVYTIHGFCGRIVSEFGSLLGLAPLWRILDQDESADAFERCFERVYRRAPPANVDHNVGIYLRLCRRALEDGQNTRILDCADPASDLAGFVAQVLEEFEHDKRQMRALEYNDLERFALELLRHDEVVAALRGRYRHMLVDEFQDTSRLQGELVERIVGKDLPVFVVGDEKQSIYRFRGANVEVFREFVQRLPAHRRLSANFRSHPEIIDAVNRVCEPILPEYDQMIATQVTRAPLFEELPRVGRVISETDAEGIVRILKTLQSRGVPLSDVVILLRRIRGNEALFDELSRNGIAVAATSSASASLDKNLGKLLNLWVWACEPWQKLRAAQVAVDFSRDANARSALKERLETLAAPHGQLSCEQLLAELDQRFQLSVTLGATFEQFELFVLKHQSQGMLPGTLARRLHRLLVNGQDIGGFSLLPPPGNLTGTVRAMTVHSAKGLEFPVVILADVKNRRARSESFVKSGSTIWLPGRDEDGELDKGAPEILTAIEFEKQAELHESARLLYVAMTRAEEALFVVDRPEPPEEPQKKEKKKSVKTPGWSAWLQAGVSDTAFFDATVDQEIIKVPKDSVAKPLRLLEPQPAQYTQARIGVTTYAHTPPPPQSNQPQRRLAHVKDAASFGTEIHALLEHENWDELHSVARGAGMDLTHFFEWLESADGKTAFGPASKRVYPEFAFEYRVSEGVVTGRIDRLVVAQDQVWVIDYKVLLHTRSVEEVVLSYAAQLKTYAQAVKVLTKCSLVRASILDLTNATGRICIDICP